MPKAKIAFIGTGFMGQKAHMDNFVALDTCEVVAFAEEKDELRSKVQTRYGIPNAFKTIEELLKFGDFDGVVASQPYNNHINVAPLVLNAGKHLMTEKPIAIAMETGDMLAKLAKKNNVHYMVGYHKRSDPAMEYAKRVITEMVASGEYGKMRLVKSIMPPGDWIGGHKAPFVTSDDVLTPSQREPLPDYFDEATAKAYDVFVNYYIHQINAIRFLLGEPYNVVFGDDSGVLLVGKSDKGVCATIEMASFSNTDDWQEEFTVCFEKAYVNIKLPAPLAQNLAGTVTVMRDGDAANAHYTIPILPKEHAMRNQARNFIKVVQGEIAPPCDAAEAVLDLKLAKQYILLMNKC